MNVPASPSTTRKPMYELQVSRYDQVSSMLIAALVLVGVAVTLMLIVWLTMHISLSQAVLTPEMVDIGEGDGMLAGGMELEGPIEEEIGMETDLDEPAVQDTLAAIADAVGAQAALLNDPVFNNESRAGRGGGARGDGRVPGHGTGSGSGVGISWEVRFISGGPLQDYARQLDFFEIELGVLMPGNQVHYAKNLTKSRPDTRVGPADTEMRCYLTWSGGDLVEADHALLTDRAQIDSRAGGRLILKFLTNELFAKLRALEKDFAAGKNETQENVRKTWFAVKEQGDGFAFFVADQSYK